MRIVKPRKLVYFAVGNEILLLFKCLISWLFRWCRPQSQNEPTKRKKIQSCSRNCQNVILSEFTRILLTKMNRIEKKEQLKQEWQQKGQDFPAELEEDFSKKFDSNVITPGTEFMHRMSKAVQVLSY